MGRKFLTMKKKGGMKGEDILDALAMLWLLHRSGILKELGEIIEKGEKKEKTNAP